MAGRLSMVQSGQAHGISRRRAGSESERPRAPLLSTHEQSAAFSAGMARAGGSFRRRPKRMDRFLWLTRNFKAAFLLRADARSNELQSSVGRIRISARKSQTLGTTQSRYLDSGASSVSRPSPPG